MKEAGKLFSKAGFRSVSIDDICRKVGVSKKTFYVYYSHKEDLINEMALLSFEKRSAELTEFIKSMGPVKLLVMIGEMADTYRFKDTLDSNLVHDLKKYYPNTYRQLTLDHKKSIRDSLSSFLEKGVEIGCFRDDIDLPAYLLMFSFISDSFMAYKEGELTVPGKKVSSKSLAKTLVDMIVRTVLSEKGWEEYRAILDDKKNKTFK